MKTMKQQLKCHICKSKLLPHPIFARAEALYCEDHGDFFIERKPGQEPRMLFRAYEPEEQEAITPPKKQKGGQSFVIQCDQTGVVYESRNDAARDLGIWNGYISFHLRGELPDVKGYTFTLIGVAGGATPRKNHRPAAEKKQPKERIYLAKKTTKPKKPIRCKETGQEFESVLAASKALGLHRPNVSHHLRGHRPHAGGYTFEYVKETDV